MHVEETFRHSYFSLDTRMSLPYDKAAQLRKTRIVCISDTHNQTPKLPKGDVLIHAGDLTKQGSYPELKRTADWLEKADFEAKIVIAGTEFFFADRLELFANCRLGNHDITLDKPFYEQHGDSWRWPRPQDPDKCRSLFVNSQSITYLQHESAEIFLTSPKGPKTHFKVFGSPYSPKRWNWAFQYSSESEATALWEAIPSDSDVVITHTPPKYHLDMGHGELTGCDTLRKALFRVRPMLSVFGHIHEARGAERICWNLDGSEEPLEESTEAWTDPGIGSNKQSLVDLTAKGRRRLRNSGSQTRHTCSSLGTSGPIRDQTAQQPQPDSLNSTSRLEGVDNEAMGRALAGGAIEYRPRGICCDIGLEPDVDAAERRRRKQETCLINAAFIGGHFGGGAKLQNKPIVVDIELPVWTTLPQDVHVNT